MLNDRGNLSIDFLAGITIFMIALIWVATMIPGLLVGVQTRTIDVDAISYRTGVILTEDPGMPFTPPWENKNDFQKNEILRFGLAASKDTPNILKMSKIERFFCSTSFSYPTDYKNRLIFGDRPYGFNISLSTFDGVLTKSVGDLKPEEYGYIRRLVKVKFPSNTTIDAQKLRNSENVTQHIFSMELNFTELIGNEPNFAYQINPRRDQIMMNFTNLSGARVYTTATNRITLGSIDIYRRNPNPPYKYSRVTVYGNDDTKFRAYIDGSGVSVTLPSLVNDNVSVVFSPGYFYGMSDDYSTLRIDYTFNLTDPDYFFNNSFTSPYSYNYSPAHVTQPQLREGVLEVATWTAPFGSYASSLITATPTPVQSPVADFYGTPRTGSKPLLVAFTDVSTGVPTTWNWTFGDIGAGNTSTLQNPTHTYASAGSYSVNLTVSNVYGGNTLIKTNYITVGLKIPIPAFTGTPLEGIAPLPVSFTDATTNAPTIWAWNFGDIGAGNTSALQNPSHTYTKTGRYTVNLTASNGDGNATEIKTNYITVNPATSWKCDVTGWNYRKNITTIRTKASGTNNDFPMLINFASDGDLAAHARSDGYDIFFTQSDGTTKIPHEIENFTKSTGELVAWVKVPTVSSSTNTTIFMYYGCATASNQQDKNNVWTTSYQSVWHLNEKTGGATAIKDSTSTANDGTDQNSPTLGASGKMGSAVTFDGFNDYISTKTSYTNPQTFTASLWFKTTSSTSKKIFGFETSQTGTGSTSYDRQIYIGTGGYVLDGVFDGVTRTVTTGSTKHDGNWHHAVMIHASNTLKLYVDGSYIGQVGTSGAENVNGWWRMGSYKLSGWPSGGDGYFSGTIDEVRIATIEKPSDWIVTEYRNQNSPSTFYSVSSEEEWSCEAPPTTPTPTPTPTPTTTPSTYTTVTFDTVGTTTWTVPAGVSSVEYLVIAGGGGGGGCEANGVGAGGGGAGGYKNGTVATTPGSGITVTVGAGGAGGAAGANSGSNGGNSVFGTITATGGGGGAGSSGSGVAGKAGGSGGGGVEGGGGGAGTSGQGNSGGGSTLYRYAGGGGGGAGAAGTAGNYGGSHNGGAGGNGMVFYITGSPLYYAGGGGGGIGDYYTYGAGGLGGGGDGGALNYHDGADATFYGSGGGGATSVTSFHPQSGGDGYKGVVIIKYQNP